MDSVCVMKRENNTNQRFVSYILIFLKEINMEIMCIL